MSRIHNKTENMFYFFSNLKSLLLALFDKSHSCILRNMMYAIFTLNKLLRICRVEIVLASSTNNFISI